MAANDDKIAALRDRLDALERVVLDLACTVASRSDKARKYFTDSFTTSLEEASPHQTAHLVALLQELRACRAVSEDALAASQAASSGRIPRLPPAR